MIHYLLDLDFEPTTRIISGTVAVTALSTVASLTTVPLDLYDHMSVSAVRRDGTSLTYHHHSDVLTIQLRFAMPNSSRMVGARSYSAGDSCVTGLFANRTPGTWW